MSSAVIAEQLPATPRLPSLRRLRVPALFVAVALALVTLLAIVGRGGNDVPLDPRNATPDGARALGVLLSERGVAVSVVDRLSDITQSSTTTVLLADPEAVSADALRALASGPATVVLVAPGPKELAAFGSVVRFDALAPSALVVAPECGLGVADTAGTVRVSGPLYSSSATATGLTACYPYDGDAALVAEDRPTGRTYVLGAGSVLTNAHLATEGDAALALGLLDTPTVQWVPTGLTAQPVPHDRTGLINLLPSRLLWAVLQLAVAVVVLAVWRGRRLGPVVREPLPVVVRAAETVEGAGRLLHAARARGSAAASLRAATSRRLARLLRLPENAEPSAVAAVAAERTGRSAPELSQVLYGGEPPDDAGLARLAAELSNVEWAVRRRDRNDTDGGRR